MTKYKQLEDGRYAKTTVHSEDEPKHLKIYYMRDNHTFRELPFDLDKAINILKEEFSDGQSYGMLCANPKGLVDPVHARSLSEMDYFITKAIPWIEKCIELNKPPIIQEEKTIQTALEHFNACEGYDEDDPIERLRFFVSCICSHPHKQNWLDAEVFFDDLITMVKELNAESV